MQIILKARPSNPITVEPLGGYYEGELAERLVRVCGIDQHTDYLTPAEARRLARALDAAADEIRRRITSG
jgi:hypothetical protein